MSSKRAIKPIRKAVIAAAGFGTRFLPQTKAIPKEMLPIIDKPIIQHVVEELVGSGITEIVIVTNYHKRSIEDHFDTPNAELTTLLEEGGKLEQLSDLKKISELASIAYVRQKEPLGNIGPLYFAQHWIGEEPFIYTWSDDFISAKPFRFQQMIDTYSQYDSSVLSCIDISEETDYDKYGIVSGAEIAPGLVDVTTIVEKPGKSDAPSSLASVSGFLFKPEIFKFINNEVQNNNKGVNTQIQPAIQAAIKSGCKVLALKIQNGKFYDTGDKLGYVKTMVDFALMHEDIKDEFTEYLKRISNIQRPKSS